MFLDNFIWYEDKKKIIRSLLLCAFYILHCIFLVFCHVWFAHEELILDMVLLTVIILISGLRRDVSSTF